MCVTFPIKFHQSKMVGTFAQSRALKGGTILACEMLPQWRKNVFHEVVRYHITNGNCYHAGLLHIETSTWACTCSLHWISQQPIMIEPCFNFTNILPVDTYIEKMLLHVRWVKSPILCLNIEQDLGQLEWFCNSNPQYACGNNYRKFRAKFFGDTSILSWNLIKCTFIFY